MSLFDKHLDLLNKAIEANHNRGFWSAYPEFPKVYGEEADPAGKAAFSGMMNNNFSELLQTSDNWIGEEVSPFLQTGIGVRYPQVSVDDLISNAQTAQKQWSKTSVNDRTGLLIESLERVKSRFFDIAYATMHTTGQAYMMSFQASGPHANDRALEVIAMAYGQLTSVVAQAEWVKPMGKFDLKLNKNYKPVPKGLGLVIGCSTFPVWNTVPGLYASLACGNVVIVKPHPKAILPIAIVVAELQKLLKEQGLDPNTVQLGVDTSENQITKQLAEHKAIRLIDFTGSNSFGNYIEKLEDKTTFTEKAGVNCAIIDSVKDIKTVAGNIAFSASLYSGQMCTAPQDIFIPAGGVDTADGHLSYEEVVSAITTAFTDLANNPKMGPHILGAIQSDATLKRLQAAGSMGGKVLLESRPIKNEEFEHSRTYSPVVIELDQSNRNIYTEECFGPVVFIIKTTSTDESLNLCEELSRSKGALTCLAWCTDEKRMAEIEERMNNVYTPVSFNFGGAAFVNQHAAFSDFHVTGGNPAGNASFTNSDYVSKRFVWVGNRYMN